MSSPRGPSGALSLLPAMLAAVPTGVLGAAGVTTLVAAILAVQAVQAGVLPRHLEPVRVVLPEAVTDPVLAIVGEVPLHVSDVRAQAGPDAGTADPDVLVSGGFLDSAAEQLALAQAAEADGLDQALEVRAALALARRRVLSEAYLDLAVSRAVTDEAVRAAYDEEAALVTSQQQVSVRHVLLGSRAQATAVRRRLDRGERFSRVAAAVSEDPATRGQGGSFGMVHPDALPDGLAAIVGTAPIGEAVGPVRTAAGWHVLRVDARRQLNPPPFETREPAIRRRLRQEALADAAERAKRIARAEAPRNGPVPGQVSANAGTSTP